MIPNMYLDHRPTHPRISAALTLVAGIDSSFSPLADLLVRVLLAASILSASFSAMMSANADPLAHLSFMEAWMGVRHAALFSLRVNALAAIFLVFGVGSRPTALVTLAILLVNSIGLSSHQQVECGLLVWIILQGAGPLSVDRMFAKGLANSAFPFAPVVMRWLSKLSVVSEPVLLLAFRIWLCLLLLGLAGSGENEFGGWTPHLTWKAWLLIPVLLGLLTPLTGLLLLFSTVLSQLIGSSSAEGLWLAMTFLPFIRSGSGPLSMDRLLARLALRQMEGVPVPHVVIVGAGFAGIACALKLRFAPVQVTLIDRRNFHLFQPLLYQVATASLSPADIARPIREIFRSDSRVRVICDPVTSIDTSKRSVVTEHTAISYDYLVLATGATHSYFGNEQWASTAPGLKTVEDALEIRRRVLWAFERAELEESVAARQRLLTFVVCGGGPTGVELAGALAELARHGLENEFRKIDPSTARVLLIHSGERVLQAFDPRASAAALADLRRLGVDVRLKTRVEDVGTAGVFVNGALIEASVVLWAAGVTASAAAMWLGAPVDAAGRVKVDERLAVPDLANIYVVGDTAASLAWEGRLVPGLAPAAKQAGEYVARVISAEATGGKRPPPFRYRHQGNLATVGRKAAVVDMKRLQLKGGLAWWMWGGIHLFFLVGTRNRLSVLLGWLWAYLTYGVGAQLITADGAGSTLPTAPPK